MIIALQTLVFFRESLLTALDRLVRPYYKHLTFAFSSANASEDEESEDQVFAEYDEEKGVVFYPPMYVQRYAAVSDCLMDERWRGKIEKVVDFGHHDMSFIKYLKEVPGIRSILGVDIETIPLRCSSDLLGGDEYAPKRETPLQVTLFQGNAADPDYRLIGCDAVIAIEMIEHMLPHDLERLVHTVFGFIKPWIVVFTTPNADFNVLFKALEKNGLRRLDHMFEWSREQFHDWCSNIVVRYPDYTVICQGVGPGPPDTLHYGCCSQLALFIAKDYHKQQDLNLNSLAMVANAPTPTKVSEVLGDGWDSPDTLTHNAGEPTIVELNPTKKLNCTTLQVKKFSKTTQNLMARNKIDCLVHTREVVNEIRHLTKTLIFNKKGQNTQEDEYLWRNINWGDNAPYWNQYYKIVREYNYPFETKSDEARILELVSDEINRLIDTQYDEEFSVDVNRLEIPLSHLMNVVQHISDDVVRVRDLLDWNGYEIVNDVVIHSRLVVDTSSVASHEDDWQDNDTVSDWDTADVRSTSISDAASTIGPDYHGRALRKALDCKVRNLRSMLSADEDITTELDRIVCRLMKLALRTSRGRQAPPPTRWIQCKLLDLLTLTEKAIGRRKKQLIESYPVKAIEFEPLTKVQDVEIEQDQDNRVKEIVDNYRHLILPIDKMTNTDDTPINPLDDIDDDFLSTTSNEFMKNSEYIQGISPSLVIPQPVFSSEVFEIEKSPSNETPLERTKAWLHIDAVEPEKDVSYPKHDNNISSGDTDHSVSNAKLKHKKSKKHKDNEVKEISAVPSRASKFSRDNCKDKKKKKSSIRITKKTSNNKKKSSYHDLVKNTSTENQVTFKRNIMENQTFKVSATKPIPESLIKLCDPELKVDKSVEDVITNFDKSNNDTIPIQPTCDISATEESFLIDIVMQDFEETIALRRTIGTDAEEVSEFIENGFVESSSIDIDHNLCTKHEVSTENVQSQTIFLCDINEPSTSKGIRHNISTDVQCGPDTLAAYPMVSASTSLVKMPQTFSKGVKIDNTTIDDKLNGIDFGTSTQDSNNVTTITPRQRSVGIKIKDSDVTIYSKTECATMKIAKPIPQLDSTVAKTHITRSIVTSRAISTPESKLIKPVSCTLKLKDSSSELNDPSIVSSSKTLSNHHNISKIASDLLIHSVSSKHSGSQKHSGINFSKPKLSCGGVHVHSYRDKQVSEDIVYQGEWQKYRPKSSGQKKNYTLPSRIINEAVMRRKQDLKEKKVTYKETFLTKKPSKLEHKLESKKSLHRRNARLLKVKLECFPNDHSKKALTPISGVKTTMKIPRPVKTITKVASKIAMSSMTPKPVKSTFTVKRPAILPNVNVKRENDKPQKLKKSYIPLYLKRAAQSSATVDKNYLNKSIDSVTTDTKKEMDTKIPSLVRSKTEEIRKDLLKFCDEVRENISYVVFRNDLEEEVQFSTDSSKNTRGQNKSSPRQVECVHTRSHSPQSFNSSTCSSPNSVATVRAVSTRAKNASNRRYSASSYKSSLNNSGSDNPMTTKIKKFFKRSKSTKKPDGKDVDNKENIPESTKNFSSNEKDKSKPIFCRHKSIYIAQIKTDTSSTGNTVSKHKVQISTKSNIKKPTPKDDDDKLKSISPSLSKRRSMKSNTSSVYEDLIQNKTDSYGSLDSANKVLVLEPHKIYEKHVRMENISLNSCTTSTNKDSNDIAAELIQKSGQSHTSNILTSVKQLLEETLNIITSSNGHDERNLDSKVILSTGNIQNLMENKVESIENIEIMNNNENNVSSIHLGFENNFNRTFNVLGDESVLSVNNTKLTVTDLDLLSFTSMTSVSKYSEYFLADSEFNTSNLMDQTIAANSGSVRDIYERRDPHLVQNAPSALAVQAFSGFSLNAEPVAGDVPDPGFLALIDSETGSLALDIARQATSEELFVSGISSESFGSCLIDEDDVVPNWLFQIISHQHSDIGPEPVLIGPVEEPRPEPLYDANGNIIEPAIVGLGAGAGDGQGMHSDHSQDSSGRGTSLSSSDTSSSPQSEAIVIDPSALTAQFEFLRDTSEQAPGEFTSNGSAGTYRIDDDAIDIHENRTRLQYGQSDDADVSSIDTDIPDSSDN